MKTGMWLQLFAEDIPLDAAPAETAEAVQEAPEETAREPEAVPEAPAVDAGLVRRHWAQVDRIYGQWMRQAEQVKQLFPEFDLAAEMKNPRFARLIRGGADIGDAYQVLHGSEILPAAMEYAARTVEQRMAGAMRSGMGRPAENGIHGGGAVMAGGTVAAMTRQDYDRICRMVERGERVTFG